MFTFQEKIDFDDNGYIVARGLFSRAEVETLSAHFMHLRQAGTYPGDMVADVPKAGDPLLCYPRMIHMHRWDDVARRWMLDERIKAYLNILLESEPFAVQSMIYFKPPGARGQALHQDNFYLQARPGTCMAAWLALDDCDEENGCMQVVPGSHRWPILCPVKADAQNSFTEIAAPVPLDMKPQPLIMAAGDVLFFGGSLVHGSFPNRSASRFRRSLIGHYVEGRAQELTQYDQPVVAMDGSERYLGFSPGGAPCGVWTEEGGQQHVEMSGHLPLPTAVE
jgi:phytanoyl-CoA hydroxylase